jgi:hypothetical protein
MSDIVCELDVVEVLWRMICRAVCEKKTLHVRPDAASENLVDFASKMPTRLQRFIDPVNQPTDACAVPCHGSSEAPDTYFISIFNI